MADLNRRQLMLGVSALAIAPAALFNGTGPVDPLLTVTTGDWQFSPHYQWYRNGEPIHGATGSTLNPRYLNLFDDDDHKIKVTVTARNALGYPFDPPRLGANRRDRRRASA